MESQWREEGHRAISQAEILQTSTSAFSPLLSPTAWLQIYCLSVLIFFQYYVFSSTFLSGLTNTLSPNFDKESW